MLSNFASVSFTPPLKLYQFTAANQNIKILHVGSVTADLSNYFSSQNCNTTVLDTVHQTTEVDIVLVNQIQTTWLPEGVAIIRPIINYTMTDSTSSNTDLVHFSLIPVLIKYLIKIKESIDFLNKNRVDSSTHRFISNVIACIDAHIDDHTFTMEHLCQGLCMSRSALSKKIKKMTGQKPTQFINAYKLKKSKHLLIVTNWQIAAIADALGFSSQQYYSRLFKKEEGISPLQYRIQNKPNSEKSIPNSANAF